MFTMAPKVCRKGSEVSTLVEGARFNYYQMCSLATYKLRQETHACTISQTDWDISVNLVDTRNMLRNSMYPITLALI